MLKRLFTHLLLAGNQDTDTGDMHVTHLLRVLVRADTLQDGLQETLPGTKTGGA
jgi:hypothetical protein